ncbi:EamA family transporter [Kribbella sp. NPDC023855]|uniref:DMT family transporter n=1 Tax=Kribbella sp. NPDC023855 TaxID=3154698 RepID=UPI0033CD99F1
MENSFRWAAVTAIAPIAWGTNYYVTHEYLPSDHPLYGAALRALPAGLLLFCLARRKPVGDWWWKSAVLGVCNVGAFFALIYVASQLLPVSVASMIMSTAPLAMGMFAWALLGERPTVPVVLGTAAGITGVCVMLGTAPSAVNLRGVAASLAAVTLSSFGYALTKKWGRPGDLIATTAWQLIAGGAVLIPFAVVFEGAPPHLGRAAIGGFVYVVLVATAVAYLAWFIGLRHLGAATVGLIGLLNPVTGVLLGTTLSGERLSTAQLAGIALILAGILVSRGRGRHGPATPGYPGSRRSEVVHAESRG